MITVVVVMVTISVVMRIVDSTLDFSSYKNLLSPTYFYVKNGHPKVR